MTAFAPVFTPEDEDEWFRLRTVDRQNAVELLQLELRLARIRGDATVTLPRDLLDIIGDCALKGLYKGQGRQRPRLSYGVRLRQQAVFLWAKRRKAELRAEMTADDAEVKAADEASAFASGRYGLNLSANYIRRRIPKSDF
jgi:hypothetical protein